MKKEYKKLFDEMIQLMNFEETDFSLLKKAKENISPVDLNFLIGEILSWLKFNDTSLKDMIQNSDFAKLFKYCDQLNELLILEHDKLTWNQDLSGDVIVEIIDYVKQSYLIDIRTRFSKE